MFSNWQASLLITDEPSNFENQNGRAYVLHTQPDGSIRGYCITRPFSWKDTDEWARRSHVCKRYFNVTLNSEMGIDPLISYGGDTDTDSVFIIYDDSNCWFGEGFSYESSKTISDKILCVAQLDEALRHLVKDEKWPNFETIVIGYRVLSDYEISTNVSSGKWQSRSLLPYPFVVFADEMTYKVEVAKEVLREYDGNTFSMMGHMPQIFDEMKIAGVKYATWKKASHDSTPEEMEKIVRMMLRLESNKEKGFFDIKHKNWQEQLAEMHKLNIGGTEFDGLDRTPIIKRYEELESSYSKLGFDPRMMELGLLKRMGGNEKSKEQIPQLEEKRDPTKWGQTLDMLKAVVKGRASDSD